MAHVIKNPKPKPATKPRPLSQKEVDRLLSVAEKGDSVRSARRRIAQIEAELADPPAPVLNPKQQLLLVGLTMQALVGLIAEYPRRHTIDFEGIVKARFLDGVREVQHKEREAGIKGGLAELSEADCRMTLEVKV